MTVFDAAGGSGALSELLANKFPGAAIILGDLAQVLAISSPSQAYQRHCFDLHQPWEINADRIILARVIHDWDDTQAQNILEHAYNSLSNGGEVVLLEMLKDSDSMSGALCDLHLLAVTGGEERSFTHYQSLLTRARFTHTTSMPRAGLVNVIKACKEVSA